MPPFLVSLRFCRPPSRKPLRKRLRTILRWRMRPVPVVFLLLALMDQLSAKIKGDSSGHSYKKFSLMFGSRSGCPLHGRKQLATLIDTGFRLSARLEPSQLICGDFQIAEWDWFHEWQLTWSELGGWVPALRTSRLLDVVRWPAATTAQCVRLVMPLTKTWCTFCLQKHRENGSN